MTAVPVHRFSLLWKILLSTSIAVTFLFAVTSWIVSNNATRTTSLSLEDEVQASFFMPTIRCGARERRCCRR